MTFNIASRVFPPPDALSEVATGRVKLRNRIAFAATANNLGSNDAITDEQLAFYERRARGGVGLVITEALSVHPSSIPSASYPLVSNEALIPGLTQLTEAVHRNGAAVYGQLHHAGGRGYVTSLADVSWSQAATRDFVSGTSPHRMTDADLEELVASFIKSATNLESAGFDGIELHAAHDFVLSQLLSPARNTREDGWGGSLENRCRALRAIVHGIRTACDDGFVVGVRLTGDEFLPDGLDRQEAGRIVGFLQQHTPIDYLSVSQGSFGTAFDRHLPDMRFPDTPFVDIAGDLKRATPTLPIMAVGKIASKDAADRVLREQGIDLVGMCRPLLADPDLVAKAIDGRSPRPCIYCNRCWNELHSGRPAECFYGSPPERGSRTGSVSSIARPNVIRVIGGGLAGLEFTRLAARGDAEVFLYEKCSRFGGKLAVEAQIPGRDRMQEAIAWLVEAARHAGARMERSCEVDQDMVASWPETDLVVQAHGANAAMTSIPAIGDSHPSVMSLEAAVTSQGGIGPRVVIIDEYDDEPVYAFAESLGSMGHDVRLVTRQEYIGRGTSYVSRIGTLRRFNRHGIDVHTTAFVSRSEANTLILRHQYSGRESAVPEVSTVICAGPYLSRPMFAESHRRRSFLIGDALSPRPPEAVVREARKVAGSI